mgnify:CR=1 FL=1
MPNSTHNKNAMLSGLKDIQAYESVPMRQRYPMENTYELIIDAARNFGSDTALAFMETAQRDEEPLNISFNELAERVHQCANLLHNMGYGETDTVSLLLPNVLETHFALWGSQVTAIANPINPLLEVSHIIEIMKETKAKVLVTQVAADNPQLWEKVELLIAQVPSLETILLVGKDTQPEKYATSTLKVLDFNAALSEQVGTHLLSERKITEHDIAAYFHTGGTTGRPKVAKVTHGGIAFVSQNYADRTAYKGRFAMLCGLPLFHIYGTVAAGIATLFAGRTIVMMTAAGFRSPHVIPNWWHHVERFKVKAFAVVPTILNSLLQTPLGDSDISVLEDVSSGAAPLQESLKTNFEETFKVSITSGYGMTESSSLLARPLPEFPPPVGSVGTRFPYMEMKIADVEGNTVREECATGEVGSVLARGPHIFAGYLNPDDDIKAWVDGDWFNTGDMGYLDEDGNLFLTGRSKDLIIRGGHNIDPSLIEEPLNKHPLVAMTIAVGQPDAYAGELPVAFVTLMNPSACDNKKDTEAELIRYCQEHISERAAVPKRIEIIDQVPVTAVGKIFKPALQNKATEYVVQQCLHAADIEATVAAHQEAKRGHVVVIGLSRKAQQAQAKIATAELPLTIEFNEQA